jgi:hypothetical protein
MSAKVSDVWRQNKGRVDKAPKKETRDWVASGNRAIEEESVERQLLEFDLTNKWGPCQGTNPKKSVLEWSIRSLWRVSL